MFKPEELIYLKRLVRDDISTLESKGKVKSDLGYKSSLEWRRKLYTRLKRLSE